MLSLIIMTQCTHLEQIIKLLLGDTPITVCICLSEHLLGLKNSSDVLWIKWPRETISTVHLMNLAMRRFKFVHQLPQQDALQPTLPAQCFPLWWAALQQVHRGWYIHFHHGPASWMPCQHTSLGIKVMVNKCERADRLGDMQASRSWLDKNNRERLRCTKIVPYLPLPKRLHLIPVNQSRDELVDRNTAIVVCIHLAHELHMIRAWWSI